MKILLTGPTGLVGSAILERLLASRHEVLAFARNPPLAQATRTGLSWCSGEFVRRTRARHWRSELPGVEVVINTIGIFREAGLQTFGLMHEEAPAALWQACVDYGVRRVVHLSALGAGLDAPTEYGRSKARGDAQLLAHEQLQAFVVRPSLIYAAAGSSAGLFRRLAALPVLAVPQGAGEVQPIDLDDVTDLVVRLATGETSPTQRIIPAVGPRILSWEAWLQVLRRGMELQAAPIARLPMWSVSAFVSVAGHFSRSLINADSWRMLQAGSAASLADAQALEQLLGRPLRAPENFVSRDHA